MASIHLDRLSKRYPNGVVAVDRLDLRVDDGELVALVGPSGCGKSTVLRLVAGLETPSDGRVIIDGADATDKPPQARDLAMVFQSYALYPHKTIRENLAFGLRMRHTPTQVIEQRVRAAAQALQLDAVLDRKPAQLSGGQRQRVALGRAMVRHPKAFLLDEPLSNLDARLRVDTRAELARLRRRLGATMLYVTHDQEEAMTLGDRLAVLRDGVLQQVADPRTVYRKPANVFVAGFIGSPAMNLFDATLRRPGGAGSLETPWMAVPLGGSAGATAASGPVVAGIRPHDLLLTAAAEEEARGRVAVLESLGREQLVHVDVGDPGAATSLVALVPARDHLRLDQEVGVRVQRDRLHFFDAATGARLPSPTDADSHT